MLEALENIPKPVLYGTAALVGLWIFWPRRDDTGQGNSGLDYTLASLNIATAGNLEALKTTAPRDVALAETYTDRYGIAQQAENDRIGMALGYLNSRMEGKNTISLAEMASDLARKQMRFDFRLNRWDQELERERQNDLFILAREKQFQEHGENIFGLSTDYQLGKSDIQLERELAPLQLEIELRRLALEETQDQRDYELAARRLDIMEMQALLGGQGIPQTVQTGADILLGSGDDPGALEKIKDLLGLGGGDDDDGGLLDTLSFGLL